MTISGVGPIVSLSFKATVDDPTRFENSKSVAAHLGLTPRVYQSGEIDRSGNISKCGDKLMRHALYEAADSHLRISKKWSTLRAWGIKLAQRIGMKKACVVVARKLAIIMHRMWVDGRDFEFGRLPVAAASLRSSRRSCCSAKDVGEGQSVSIPVTVLASSTRC
jgi:transposase